MGSRLKVRKKIFDIVKLNSLYLILKIKIILLGYLLVKVRHLKAILPFFLGMIFILLTPNLFWALGAQWPWDFVGWNFEITKGAEENHFPVIASNNDLHLAVWYRKASSGSSGFDIYGARISKDGQVLDEEGIPISTAPYDQMFPSISWDGENFFIVWQDRRSGVRWDIYGARVTPDGEVLDPGGIQIATGRLTYDQVSPALSFDGENYLVVWCGKRTPKISNIYFKRVSRNGGILDGRPISLNAYFADQAAPALVFNGQNYFIVWQDKRDGDFWNIYGARVTPSGEILDQNGIKLTYSDEELKWDRYNPIVTWNGNYHLIIWRVSPTISEWDLYGKRVNSAGEVIDLIEPHVQKDEINKTNPAVLWDGQMFFLVWEEEPEGNSKIFGAPIAIDYAHFLVGSKVQISTSQETDASYPALSMSGDRILVIWQAKSPDNYWRIYGQRFLKIP